MSLCQPTLGSKSRCFFYQPSADSLPVNMTTVVITVHCDLGFSEPHPLRTLTAAFEVPPTVSGIIARQATVLALPNCTAVLYDDPDATCRQSATTELRQIEGSSTQKPTLPQNTGCNARAYVPNMPKHRSGLSGFMLLHLAPYTTTD